MPEWLEVGYGVLDTPESCYASIIDRYTGDPTLVAVEPEDTRWPYVTSLLRVGGFSPPGWAPVGEDLA